jgi:hypothetical protein
MLSAKHASQKIDNFFSISDLLKIYRQGKWRYKLNVNFKDFFYQARSKTFNIAQETLLRNVFFALFNWSFFDSPLLFNTYCELFKAPNKVTGAKTISLINKKRKASNLSLVRISCWPILQEVLGVNI